jgi:hypothetical protein
VFVAIGHTPNSSLFHGQLDTDANGYEGYVLDVSRTFLCGDEATAGQKEAYRIAYDCVNGMRKLLKPGMTFGDFSLAAPKLPDGYVNGRYGTMAHQAGLEDEGPGIPYPQDMRDDSPAARVIQEIDQGLPVLRGEGQCRLDNLDRVHVSVCLNLSPQWRASAPAAQTNTVHRNVHLGKNRKAVPQTERNALKDCADDMSACVGSRQAD